MYDYILLNMTLDHYIIISNYYKIQIIVNLAFLYLLFYQNTEKVIYEIKCSLILTLFT